MPQDPFAVAVAIGAAVLVSSVLSRLTNVPYPVFLVCTGLLASLVPGMPVPSLDPDVVFYVFLPPLIYYAGFLTSPRELRTNWRSISLLAVVLVLVTVAAVAVVAHALLPGFGWATAFVLGAVVAPTDPTAASAVMGRLGAPRRLTTLLENESLLNDGIALTIYGVAVTAVVQGRFSVGDGLLRFVQVVAGGVAFGLLVGWVVAAVRKRIDDPNLEITLSLFTPYVAYVPADRMQLSGVLAAVTCGVFIGSQSTGMFRPGVRLQANAFWQQLDFLLNSVLFVLLGLQFAAIVGGAGSPSTGRFVVYAVVVSLVVIGSRVLFEFAVAPLTTRGRAPRSGGAPWRDRLVMGWSGIRGALSLAAALAIPYSVQGGGAFPGRGLILFLTFTVILATLVVQGTTLPAVIRVLGLSGQGFGGRREREARLAMAEAAIARADELARRDDAPAEVLAELRERYERQRRMLQAGEDDEAEEPAVSPAEYRRLRRSVIAAQRRELNRRHRAGQLHADEARRLRRDLDLEESLLE